MAAKNLGWIFHANGVEGEPYLQCPYCNRKVGGRRILFAQVEYFFCPSCEKTLNFDNIKEDDWNYINSYYGGKN